jgi:ammonia channel protein AmtB
MQSVSSNGALEAAFAVGILASVVALTFSMMLLSFIVPEDNIVAFDEHVIGGTSDTIAAATAAVFFGAIGIAALLTGRPKHVRPRRRRVADALFTKTQQHIPRC